MNQNPYSPLDAAPVVTEPGRSTAHTVMFWLSCVLGLVMLTIAANGGYQYWVYTSQAGLPLPGSILGETVCVALSGLGMLYSATRWRHQRTRAGAVLFACSLLAFLVGPLLI